MVVFTYQRVCMCVLFTCVFIGSSVSHISLLKGGTTYREQCFPEFYTYLFFFCVFIFGLLLCFVCLCVVLQLKFLYHVLNLVISCICQAHTTGVSSRFKPDWFLPTLGGAIWCGCLIKDYLAFRVQHLDGYVSVFQEGTTVPVKKDIQGEANGAAEQLWTS